MQIVIALSLNPGGLIRIIESRRNCLPNDSIAVITVDFDLNQKRIKPVSRAAVNKIGILSLAKLKIPKA